MPAPVTLANLRLRTLRRADMLTPAGTPTNFIDSTANGELDTYIRESGREFYDLLVKNWGEDYFATSANLTTTAGVENVALPNDFYKLLAVDYYPAGATTPMHMRRFNWNERATTGPGMGYGWVREQPAYRLRMNNLWLHPTPDGVYNLTVHYVPITGDAWDPIEGVNGWEDYIVCAAAIKCLAKEESDTSELRAELARHAQRIADMAPRDGGEPHYVQDIYINSGFGWDDM